MCPRLDIFLIVFILREQVRPLLFFLFDQGKKSRGPLLLHPGVPGQQDLRMVLIRVGKIIFKCPSDPSFPNIQHRAQKQKREDREQDQCRRYESKSTCIRRP